jgi:peptide/nickel transport system substrate-binding protein
MLRASILPLFLLAGIGLLAPACDGPSPAPPGQPEAASAPGATATSPGPLIWAASLASRDLNPVLHEWNEASALIVSRLFTIGLDGQIEGDLAEGYELSPDHGSYTITLREGVEWHDGTPFTSADVEFTLREVLDPDGAAVDRRLNLGPVSSVSAPDPGTVVITLESPNLALTTPLADLGILPRHLFDGRDFNDPSVFQENPVGTGPYVWDGGSDREMRFRVHTGYHRGAPAVEELVLRPIPNDDERAEAVARGEIHVAQVTPNHVSRLSRIDGVTVHRFRTGVWRSLMLNLRHPPLSDTRVRRAISLALDREAMVARGLEGMGEAAYWAVPPANWAYPGPPERTGRDLETARALLDEAGWTVGEDGVRRRDGEVLAFTVISLQDEVFRRTSGEILRDNLSEVGIRVDLHPVDRDVYGTFGSDLGPDLHGIIAGWSALTDPGDNLVKKYRTGGSQNAMGYSNPEMDRLLDLAVAEPDRERARELYAQVLELVARDASNMPLAYPDYVFAIRDDVTGIGDFVLDNFYEFTRFAYRLGLS